jgi:UDP-glucose 4-epimerase
MKTVVTGATGRVGANLIRRLCEKGLDVTACILPNDADEAKLDGMSISKAYIDIVDTSGVAEMIYGADVVIHTAAVHEASLASIPGVQFFDTNVKGMFNVLEGVRLSGRNTQLICLSSSAVYDVFTMPQTPVTENQERRPITIYGMTKILVEELTRQYEWQHGIPATIVRPNYIVSGPEMVDAFNYSVVFDVLQKYAGNAKVQFHVPEEADAWMKEPHGSKPALNSPCIPRCPKKKSWHWHMTDIRDVIDLIELCIDNDKAYGKTFNIAGADLCDWPKIVTYIAEKTGREAVDIKLKNLWRYSFDLTASKEALGFTPKYDHIAMADMAIAMHNGEDVGIIPGKTSPF